MSYILQSLSDHSDLSGCVPGRTSRAAANPRKLPSSIEPQAADGGAPDGDITPDTIQAPGAASSAPPVGPPKAPLDFKDALAAGASALQNALAAGDALPDLAKKKPKRRR